MPQYALQCRQETCSHKWEAFARMGERRSIRCPRCGAADPHTDFDKSNVKPERSWDERGEGKSLMFSFDPAGMKTLKAEMPSAEFNADGDMLFRSNSHQRRVFGEMNAARRRYREQDLAQADRRTPIDSDIAEAAKAIGDKENVR